MNTKVARPPLAGKGTPQYTSMMFLYHWAKRDWKAMYSCCQKTWQSNFDVGRVRQIFGNIKLKKAEPVLTGTDEGLNGDVIQDVIASVRVSIENTTLDKILNFRLVKETAPYEASIDGEWGVNPLSCLRGLQLSKEGLKELSN
jgi:hypothetical protein